MTLNEAAKLGISRVRLSEWRNGCYLKIDIFTDGMRGPWGHLYDRQAQELIGTTTPQDILCIQDNEDWLEYTEQINQSE